MKGKGFFLRLRAKRNQKQFLSETVGLREMIWSPMVGDQRERTKMPHWYPVGLLLFRLIRLIGRGGLRLLDRRWRLGRRLVLRLELGTDYRKRSRVQFGGRRSQNQDLRRALHRFRT